VHRLFQVPHHDRKINDVTGQREQENAFCAVAVKRRPPNPVVTAFVYSCVDA
jgi:hypothetical protein